MNDTVEDIEVGTGVKRLNKLPMTIALVLGGIVAIVFVYALTQRLSDRQSVLEAEEVEKQTILTADNTEIIGSEPTAGVIPEAPPVLEQPVPSGSQRVIAAGDPAVRYEVGSGSGVNSRQLAGASETEQEAMAELRRKNAIERETYFLEQQMQRLRFRDSAEQQARNSPMDIAYDNGRSDSSDTGRSSAGGGGATLGGFSGLNANGLPSGDVSGLGSPTSLADAQAQQLATLASLQGGGAAGGSGDQNNQAGKRAFIAGADNNEDYSDNVLQNPISPYELKQGTIIPALMVSGINSDLPGNIIAQVSQNVYDSVTGTHLLIPQGTRLFGQYDSGVTFGQKRVLIVWNRLILPNGKSINIDSIVGSDSQGRSGLQDKVNRHLFSLYGQAILLSAISGATEALTQSGTSNDSDLERAISREFGNGLQDTTQEVIEREIQRQPTITIRPGKKLVILVDKDFILEPYVSKTATRR